MGLKSKRNPRSTPLAASFYGPVSSGRCFYWVKDLKDEKDPPFSTRAVAPFDLGSVFAVPDPKTWDSWRSSAKTWAFP